MSASSLAAGFIRWSKELLFQPKLSERSLRAELGQSARRGVVDLGITRAGDLAPAVERQPMSQLLQCPAEPLGLALARREECFQMRQAFRLNACGFFRS